MEFDILEIEVCRVCDLFLLICIKYCLEVWKFGSLKIVSKSVFILIM